MSVTERREREREQRRDRILDAAKRVFYAKGIDAVKMIDVAREAQLGKGTLYLYFKTKNELLMGVAIRHQQQLLDAFRELQKNAPSGGQLVRDLLFAYAEHMAEPNEHLKIVMCRWASGVELDMDSRSAAQMRKNIGEILGSLCDAIERGKVEGNLSTSLETPRVAMSLIAAVDGALLMKLKHACFNNDVLADVLRPTMDQCIDLYVRSIGVPTAEQPPLAAVGAE